MSFWTWGLTIKICIHIICMHMKPHTPKQAPTTGSQGGPGSLLWQASKIWQRHRKESLRLLGLSPAQLVILANLVRLAKQYPYVTQTMLSAQTKIDLMMTSQVIRSLEQKGLVVRKPHPEDQRAKQVLITPHGEKIAMQGVRAVEKTNERFFAPLGKDLPELVRLLHILISSNDKPGSEKSPSSMRDATHDYAP